MSGTTRALLNQIGNRLDVPISQQEKAIGRYQHLGTWLYENQLGRADSQIYPQGSFRLGTVVRPTDAGLDFDIDLVFLRSIRPESTTQESLKEECGELLALYCDAESLDEPVELGRCWRLDLFDDGFHLDVLPVIPDARVESGVLLSDRDLREWQFSNPIGYADWFYQQMNQSQLEESLRRLAKSLNRSIEGVPRFWVKTPLQQVVQLLKRSRDIYFAESTSEPPTSVLLTTLAAKSYIGARSLDQALLDVIDRLDDHIEVRGSEWWLENPAHSEENFADKWNTDPPRRDAFYEWLSAVRASLVESQSSSAVERVGDMLKVAFGSVSLDAAMDLSNKQPGSMTKAASGQARAPNEQFIEERFPVNVHESVHISYAVASPSSINRYQRRRQRRLGKRASIKFTIDRCSVHEPYDVYWKIRNFGREAMDAGGLRGAIQGDAGRRETIESTLYRGDHYAEAYVIKDGVCVARDRAWVPIA